MSDVRIMTFNIRGAVYGSDGENVWENRAMLNVATIRKYSPDLIGFQELMTGNMETYREHLTEYDHFMGPEYGNNAPHCYPTIFWKSSRWSLLNSGGFWLSTTPERHSGDWGTACIRSAAWVKLRDMKSGFTIVHLNTHLDHRCELARVEGAKVILDQLRQLDCDNAPCLVTADFNCGPQSDVYALFLDNGFGDTFLHAGNDDSEEAFTFHGFEGDQRSKRTRMDWILLRDEHNGATTRSCFIARDQQPPLYPSDHYPVVADLAISQ